MSTIYGFGFNEVKPQPGFTATKSKEGGWAGSHSFAIKRIAWGNASVRGRFAQGTAITDLDPDLPSYWNFMKIVEPRVTSEEGDIIKVEVTIAGGEGATYDEGDLAANTEPTYSLRGQLQDAPFSIHPKWAALSTLEKGGLGLLLNGLAIFDPPTGKVGQFDYSANVFNATQAGGVDVIITSADGLLFANLINSGETTYLRPTFTWTESAQGTGGLTNAQINLLGNIAIPRGNPPEPSGTRDWMLTSAFQEERAELFTTELEWTLSEKGGHNQLLYVPA
jgi:hypothetical protein